MNAYKTLGLSLAIALLSPTLAHAWLRPSCEDATVVERSELIVVGHLKADSIKYVLHERKADEGRSWEHHATLVISDVLKGSLDSRRIPIIVHYGLSPRVGGISVSHSFDPDQGLSSKDDPKAAIYILDTGNSAMSFSALVSDAGKDNLWFLRKRSGVYGRKPGSGKYGIVDPEDLQPLELKDYFLAYLSKDPELAVKRHMANNPAVAQRAQRYLDHLETHRILKIEDPTQRLEKLLPFYVKRTPEAREGIISCGMTAGKQLRKIFDDPERADLRDDIIRMWRDIGYKEAVPVLIDLLKKHDRFWAKQELQKGWWNKDVGSEQTRRRRDVYGEVYYGVSALRTFKDRRAKSVIEQTRNRWKAINFDNQQIVEECEAALQELAANKGTAQQ
jgi:hypothetical protein